MWSKIKSWNIFLVNSLYIILFFSSAIFNLIKKGSISVKETFFNVVLFESSSKKATILLLTLDKSFFISSIENALISEKIFF